jgi:hypothetical protein
MSNHQSRLSVIPEAPPPPSGPFVDGGTNGVPEKINGNHAAPAPTSTPTPPPAAKPEAKTPEQGSAKAPAEGRAEGGRFAKGNRGGPGNPFARKVAKLRSVLLDAVDPDRLKRIVLKLIDMAEAGDIAAMKLLFSYSLGQPDKAVSPDELDLAEWRLADSMPTKSAVLRAILDSVDPKEAAQLLDVLAHDISAKDRVFSRGDELLMKDARAEQKARIGQR